MAPSSAAPPDGAAGLHEQLRLALERAQLAEHREEHHQARWAGEIHELREQVRSLKDAAHRLPIVEREVQDRSRELAAAYHRITDLEEELRRLRGD
jgi:chromosome segregation ATPase